MNGSVGSGRQRKRSASSRKYWKNTKLWGMDTPVSWSMCLNLQLITRRYFQWHLKPDNRLTVLGFFCYCVAKLILFWIASYYQVFHIAFHLFFNISCQFCGNPICGSFISGWYSKSKDCICPNTSTFHPALSG